MNNSTHQNTNLVSVATSVPGTISQPIVKVGIEAAFAEINFSPERFRLRGGDYDTATGLTRPQ